MLMFGGGHELASNVNVQKFIVTLLPHCNNTCVDHFTWWLEAIPIVNSTADTVAKAFVHTWVSHFGVPSTVTTDHGRQFESHLWKSLTQLLGIRHVRTTAYHPQLNGLIKCLHRQLKSALKASPQPEHWADMLPMTLLELRTSL